MTGKDYQNIKWVYYRVMQSIYTKPLLVIFLLLTLSIGLLIIQHMAKKQAIVENFISDDMYNSQIKFINEQMGKAMMGDATIDILHLSKPEDLKKATEDLDIFAKRERPKTENWYSDVMNSEIWQKEMKCRAMELPEDLPDDTVKQRLDCAWMYSPNGRSGATLASISGPVFSSSRNMYPKSQYEMIWSKTEAVKKEKIKFCALTKKCDLLVPGNHCGFCPEYGQAVPVDLNGNSLYFEAYCPARPVMKPEDCMKPRSEGGAGYTINSCKPDANGNLSKSCLTDLAEMAGCQGNGTILQALKDSTVPTIATQEVRDTVDVMQSYNFNIPTNLFTDGSVTVNTALNTFTSIAGAYWKPARNERAGRAALNLCYGVPFNPCEYQEESKEKFKLKCLQELYQSVGCQGRGSEFPTQDNIDKFYDKTWGSIKKSLNLTVDMMTNVKGTYKVEQQKDAIERCIGVRLRKRATTYCNELGIAVFMYYGSPNGTFYGRKIITNMFFSLRSDSTFWDLLEIFNSPLTGGNRIYLVIKTNFNPDQGSVQSFTRYGSFIDVIKWNDVPMVNKNGTGIAQDQVNGLILKKNTQDNQRLEIDIAVDYSQYSQREGMWYMTDAAGNAPPITICRLPIERKNPLMNIVMNGGEINEATGNVGIQPMNCTPGTLGGQSCTLFNGNTWIRIGNTLRTRAFRSYTMKVWCNGLENRDAFFSFYNGKWEQEQKIRWIVIPLGFFIWIPIPLFYMEWRYFPDNWWKSGQRTELSTGPYNDTLQALEKPNIDGGLSINAEQGGIIKPKTWQHFTWIWNSDFSGIDIYVDGVKKMSGSGNPLEEQLTSENFVGRSVVDNDHRLHRGGMQWFRGFDYPLTADEIRQDMDDDW